MSDAAWRIWFAWAYLGVMVGVIWAAVVWVIWPLPIAWGLASLIGLALGWRRERKHRTYWGTNG